MRTRGRARGGRVCFNFLGDEGQDRVRAAYGDTECRRRYDPDNVFRLNQNIGPAAE